MVKRILILSVVLASGVAVGLADDVWIGKLPYRDVRVVSVKGGFISFTLRGRTLSKPLRDVTKVQLSSKAEFNKAEGLLSSGKHEQAVAAFEVALTKAHEPWLKTLIRHRQALALKRKAPGRVVGKAATTRPAKGRVKKKPSSAPSATTKPAKWADTPEALFRSMPKPPDYRGMTTLRKTQAAKKYAATLEKWRKGQLGKEVKWVLQIVDIRQSRPGREIVLLAESRTRIKIRARFPSKSASVLAKFSKGQIAEVGGKIIDCRDSSVVLQGRSVRPPARRRGPVPRPPASGPEAGEVDFLGIKAEAHHVVLVLDRSGSMIDNFDYVRAEMKKTITWMLPVQTFHIVLFARGMGAKDENPPRRLVHATKENKRLTLKYLRGADARGGAPTNPLGALDRAFQVLSKPPNKGKEKVLFLLTDGVFHDNKAVRQAILRWNKTKDVRVNTILFGTGGETMEKALRQIAEENGGQFKFVSRSE